MILAFLYHDPQGQLNPAFRRQLDTLKSTFSAICLSATPPTSQGNASFIQELREGGCLTSHSEPHSSIGDHSRSALQLAVEQTHARQPVFFGFPDRVLFALETEFRTDLFQDIERHRATDCMAFERTRSAWDTHPSNYREIERMISRIGELLYGSYMEISPCAFILSPTTVDILLAQSITTSYAVWAEWVLLAAKNGIPITTKKVDWLAWEDPYWEQAEPDALKRVRENSKEEIFKRIQFNMPIALLMAEPRFRDLTLSRHPLS